MMNRRHYFSGLAPAVLAIGLLLSGPRAARAQASGQLGGANTLNTAMLKLFGTNTAFTAKADIHVVDKIKQETDMPIVFAMLDNKTRMEADLNLAKSAAMPPALLPTLKQIGMDQMVIITRPDKQFTLNVYPRAKAYAEIAMSKDDTAEADKNFKLDKTPEGKETVDGHACQKNKVILTGDKGDKVEAEVWNATDLKDFPIQMQTTNSSGLVRITFKDVKLARPDAKQFEAPAGMTRYASAEAILEALTKPPTSADTRK